MAAARSKDAWLSGAGDVKEAVVEDVPVAGESVKVRGLPAAFSNRATSEALEMKQVGRDQVATVNTEKLENIQFRLGVIDPVFTAEEVEQISSRYGPAFKKVVEKIDELSGVDKEEVASAQAKFPAGGAGTNGAAKDGAAGGGS